VSDTRCLRLEVSVLRRLTVGLAQEMKSNAISHGKHYRLVDIKFREQFNIKPKLGGKEALSFVWVMWSTSKSNKTNRWKSHKITDVYEQNNIEKLQVISRIYMCFCFKSLQWPTRTICMVLMLTPKPQALGLSWYTKLFSKHFLHITERKIKLTKITYLLNNHHTLHKL